MQIGPVGEELSYADGHDGANSRFSQIATASENYSHQYPLTFRPPAWPFLSHGLCWLTYVKRGMERGSLENVQFTQ